MCVAVLLCGAGGVEARQRGVPAGPAPTARASAPVDLTGYWISLVTEDWRYRMVVPKKGDNPSIPVNAEGKRLVDAWDPAKDAAAGEQCRAFGAGNIMRMPGRIHITWDGDTVLRVDTEAGTQTRRFRFGGVAPSTGLPSWQGDSVAQWEYAGGRAPRGGATATAGNLKVVTTRMRPGYLQLNGVPYSGNAVVTEYFHAAKHATGDEWLFVTTIVEDPQYLTARFVRSSHFKKLPDGSSWKPVPCVAH
jgi:hypothetical protein